MNKLNLTTGDYECLRLSTVKIWSCCWSHKFCTSSLWYRPCTGLARLKFQLTNQDSADGKPVLSWRQMHVTIKVKAWSRATFFSGYGNKCSRKVIYNGKNIISVCNKGKMWNILGLKTFRLISCQKGVASDQQLALRSLSPGRIKEVSFWTKYAIASEIVTVKPRILELSIRRGQSKCGIVFTLVSSEEEHYYPAISEGQHDFHDPSYCGRKHCMQELKSGSCKHPIKHFSK